MRIIDVQNYKDQYDIITSSLNSVCNKKYSNNLKISSNIALLDMICCYRGWRHFKGLPVRGQRT